MRGKARFRPPKEVTWIDDMELLVLHETEKAYGVALAEGAKLVWLPKSQIKIADKYGEYIQVSVPEWLAKEKELI